MENDSEVVWTVVDSLLGGPAAAAPTYLFISTLINGQRGSKVNLLLWKNLDLKTNKYSFCLACGGAEWDWECFMQTVNS